MSSMSISFNEIVDYLIEISFFFSCFFFIRILILRRTLFAKYLDRIGHIKRTVRVESWENIFLFEKRMRLQCDGIDARNSVFSKIKIEYYRLKSNLTDDVTSKLIYYIVIEIFVFL